MRIKLNNISARGHNKLTSCISDSSDKIATLVQDHVRNAEVSSHKDSPYKMP